ncbi:C-Jun-amino-terminal kinase-interacting protein 1a [Hypomesus transpacificus]|uniref:C-Jun-amino-terminal kinase-interacting protein 1a n=1 Tax=Hypomesus transpacificus TaxID=137520 RepID=UPI001F072717|nr:C-Jun-amino-terminal kinase-interacting protein 1a [Hypomesus transpacificus]XP_046889916.1 C-Jun-amino-terminal kinase-interacting protein 1a [Hypomesus transpacificus]
MLLHQDMEPSQDEDNWMEDQWEKWLTHDFSLDEFEDEDLSQVTEITDECGGSLSCDDLDCKDHVTCPANSGAGRADRRWSREQDLELLQLDLIDAEDQIEEEEEEEQDRGLLHAAHPRLDHQQREEEEREEEKRAAILQPPIGPAPAERDSAPVTMDTYRPKRPTTLALFPQVPRTQDTINNNSFGKKDTWKESNSSSPHITGDLTPTQGHVQQTEGEVQLSSSSASKLRGTASSHSRTTRGVAADTQSGPRDQNTTAPHRPSSTQRSQRRAAGAGMREGAGVREEAYGRRASLEQQPPEPTDEIYLTPVQKDPDRPFLSMSSEGNRMSISSDTEGPSQHPHPSLPDRTNPSISEEEEEVYPPVPPPGGETSSGCLTASEGRQEHTKPGREGGSGGALRTGQSSSCEANAGLSYDSVKYTLVVDEHAQLELVSLKQCYHSYSDGGDDSDGETVYESANEDEDEHNEEGRHRMKRDSSTSTSSHLSKAPSSSESLGAPHSRKFLNVFVNGHRRRAGTESFGLFSCVLDGVEREQSHRAVFRFVPRHEDELELERDDPLLIGEQAEDLWCQAYNMRTGASGIFPAYYAAKVNQEHLKGSPGDVTDRFRVRFLGSVQVPYHKGNDVLCAAMQKIAANRRMSMQPPSACVVEISLKGVKIIVQDECKTSERGDKCFHFFQLKNISFCGCHPKHNKYFGFITKHPDHQKFACHVVMSEDSSIPLAESVGRAFKQYYKEHMGYSCPTEDIFLE